MTSLNHKVLKLPFYNLRDICMQYDIAWCTKWYDSFDVFQVYVQKQYYKISLDDEMENTCLLWIQPVVNSGNSDGGVVEFVDICKRIFLIKICVLVVPMASRCISCTRKALPCQCYWHPGVYRKISNIRRTMSQNLNVSRLVLQMSLYNLLSSGVKSTMTM